MMLGIIDIDHFKLINDTYGHQVGDETVTVIGNVLSDELDIALVAPEEGNFTLDYNYDYGNIAGRLGGDEFIFLIKSVVNIEDGKRLMRSLIDRLNRTSFGEITTIQGSVGIVPIDSDDYTFDSLYHRADIALYSAKNSGRNRCVVYKEGMKESAIESGVDSLTGLLENKEFKKKAVRHLSDNMGKKESIIYIDIENFKAFNAKYGFDKGDELLIDVAAALTNVFEGDLVSRFSGDHFVVLTSTENDVKALVEDVKTRVNEELPDFVTKYL
jgi:GGDEF domain-containing protein